MRLQWVILVLMFVSCAEKTPTVSLDSLDKSMELSLRLEESEFSILDSEIPAVEYSYSVLNSGEDLSGTWYIEFAGKEVDVAAIDKGASWGLVYENQRRTAIYENDKFEVPAYGEIEPLAITHYIIPENEISVVLMLVCFQTDPTNDPRGLSVRSVDREGMETSAPFAVALNISELHGLMFYDEFIESGEKYAVAARKDWDRGCLLLTKISGETVLSTYLPWY